MATVEVSALGVDKYLQKEAKAEGEAHKKVAICRRLHGHLPRQPRLAESPGEAENRCCHRLAHPEKGLRDVTRRAPGLAGNVPNSCMSKMVAVISISEGGRGVEVLCGEVGIKCATSALVKSLTLLVPVYCVLLPDLGVAVYWG